MNGVDFAAGARPGGVPLLVLGIDAIGGVTVGELLAGAAGRALVIVTDDPLAVPDHMPADQVAMVSRDEPDPAHSQPAPQPLDELLAWLMGVDLDGRPVEVEELPALVRETLLARVDNVGAARWMEAAADHVADVHRLCAEVSQADLIARVSMATVVPPEQPSWQYMLDSAVDFETTMETLLALHSGGGAVVLAVKSESAQHVWRTLQSLAARRLVPPVPIHPDDMAVSDILFEGGLVLDDWGDVRRWLGIAGGPPSGASAAPVSRANAADGPRGRADAAWPAAYRLRRPHDSAQSPDLPERSLQDAWLPSPDSPDQHGLPMEWGHQDY